MCNARNGRCLCGRQGEHTLHACAESSPTTHSGRCHGKWREGVAGTIQVVQYPTGVTSAAAAYRQLQHFLLHPDASIADRGHRR